MNKETVISVAYDRIPEKVIYKAKINVDLVSVEDGKASEEYVCRIGKSAATMDNILEHIHKLLQEHPNARVTMVRGTTRPTHFGQRASRGFELDTTMRDLIRDDLPEAKKKFAPVEHTVQVRVTPPRVPIKE